MRKDLFPPFTCGYCEVQNAARGNAREKRALDKEGDEARTAPCTISDSVDGALRRETRQMQLQLCARLT